MKLNLQCILTYVKYQNEVEVDVSTRVTNRKVQ